MFKVSLNHTASSAQGGVEYTAPNVFSAYRLAFAYIQIEGYIDSTFLIECNGEQMTCSKVISRDLIKSFFQHIVAE